MVGTRRFFTVNQIDATGAGSPHQRELEEYSANKFSLFKGLEEATLRSIVYGELGARLDNVGLNEDWTITIEFFPEAKVHISYFYYGDEFGDVEGELKFLFSGEQVYMIPGEDMVTYTGIILDFIERRIKNQEPIDKGYGEKTELMKKILEQRKEPFNLLEKKDAEELGKFIGGEITIRGSNWNIKREVLPEIFVEVTFDKGKNMLDTSYSGKNLTKIGRYHLELIATFTINHILRYIALRNQDKKLPTICYKMFSRLFTKEKGWNHRKAS